MINPFDKINCQSCQRKKLIPYYCELAVFLKEKYRALFWEAVSNLIWKNRFLKYRIEHLEKHK